MIQHGGNGFFQNTCIDFSANINFLGIPDLVMQAARSGLMAAVQSPQESSGSLEEHIAQWEGVEPAHVFCSNGASEVVKGLVQVLQPKKALLPAPGFEEYLRPLSMVQCGITYYYTKEEDDFLIPLDDFLAHITQDIDLVFCCNPNNPTATLYDQEFLQQVLKRCEQTNTMLALDECCLDFVENAQALSMHEKNADKRLFIIKDFTKMFAMPGIRLGYGLCTDRALIEKLRGNLQPWCESSVAKKAGIACTKEQEFVQKTVQETAKERVWLLEQLNQIGIGKVKGEANMIFFKSRPGLHAFGMMHGIILRDCSNLEGMPQGNYRIAVRSREENEKLIEVLKQWQSQS